MFGNRKMYKKGMEDALSANEGFSQKQQEALQELRRQVKAGQITMEEGLAKLGDDIHGLYDFLDAKEKAALYHLSTPLDIRKMEENERQLLVAVLCQLANDEGSDITELQQTYLSGVQRYVGITAPQATLDDISVVGEIDSGAAQRAIMQTVLEFLYLQDTDELSDSQEELLSCFSVNQKQGIVIENNVSLLYNAMGARGLAEKYGVVPQANEISGKRVVSSEVDMAALSQKLLELYNGNDLMTIECLTANYIILEMRNIFNKKTYRLDIRTLEQALVPDSKLLPSHGIVLQDSIIFDLFGDCGTTVYEYDTAHMRRTVLTDAVKRAFGLKASEEYILIYGVGENDRSTWQVLSRIDGSTDILEYTSDRKWEDLVDDKLYNVNCKGFDLLTNGTLEAYDIKTKQITALGTVPWKFSPFAVCGKNIFGIIPGIVSQKTVSVFDCETRRVSTLLDYKESSYEQRWCRRIGNHVILAGENADNSLEVYDLNLETTEVRVLLRLKDEERRNLIGPIGSSLYYVQPNDKGCLNEEKAAETSLAKICEIPFGT